MHHPIGNRRLDRTAHLPIDATRRLHERHMYLPAAGMGCAVHLPGHFPSEFTKMKNPLDKTQQPF
jgi:hypothetical protein